MNLPPFVYALSFWNAISFLIAGVLGLLAYFGKIKQSLALSAAAVLAILLSILHFFGIVPELMLRGLL